MKKENGTNFPDSRFLNNLIQRMMRKTDSHKPLEKLVTHCGANLNWVADYITDENIQWNKQTLPIEKLWLTGTGPVWNKIVIDKCERSPQKLRELFKTDSSMVKIFSEAILEDTPILVRFEENKYKVLDGMHRAIAAIRDGRKNIRAFVTVPKGKPKPKCEPHVIYDFLRSYQREINTNRDELIAALRFLRHSYVNVEDLLKHRFNESYIYDDQIQKIIQEALKD